MGNNLENNELQRKEQVVQNLLSELSRKLEGKRILPKIIEEEKRILALSKSIPSLSFVYNNQPGLLWDKLDNLEKDIHSLIRFSKDTEAERQNLIYQIELARGLQRDLRRKVREFSEAGDLTRTKWLEVVRLCRSAKGLVLEAANSLALNDGTWITHLRKISSIIQVLTESMQSVEASPRVSSDVISERARSISWTITNLRTQRLSLNKAS